MLRKLLFTLCIVLTSWSLALAQVGRLQGTVIDKDTGEPIPFANIVLENGGTQVGGTSSDFDGNYDINPIPPGTYDLKATFVGYNTFVMKGVVIPANKITFQDVRMSMQTEMLDAVEIVDYKALGQEDPLEKEMTMHSSILAWEIPWTEEPSRLQSTQSQELAMT